MSRPPTGTERRTTSLAGVRVPYTLRRSDRATRSRIDVDLRGVRVVVPRGARVDPDRLLGAHAAWVLEQRAAVEVRREQVPERRFEAGATFPYRGEPHEVVIERRARSDVRTAASDPPNDPSIDPPSDDEGASTTAAAARQVDDRTDPTSGTVDDPGRERVAARTTRPVGTLRLARHHVEQTSVRRALECLYRRLARTAFTEQAERYAHRMDVAYDRIEVRNQRTRWGSCSSRGTLSLNWRLVMAPPAVLEYVVVHELAHLREPNHSASFWAIVARQVPDYEARRAWLRDHRLDLVFTEDDL